MSEDRYLSRKTVSKSYRPRSYVMSPGLLRARAPFRLQNALTGLVLAGFVSGVWVYSIRAVKQDDFSDVDAEAREIMTAATAGSASEAEVVRKGSGLDSEVVDVNANMPKRDDSVRHTSPPRGILAPVLDRAFPHLLDPVGKTLVWGAPPLDNLGRICLRGSSGR